eukprot:GHVU01203037.1.p1 GENE.GHVU01203037.1~~GHVU01203037.1.p1  ORF type:complete len:283 (-),score=30.55 GHVU01203037.1:1421-2269(-)
MSRPGAPAAASAAWATSPRTDGGSVTAVAGGAEHGDEGGIGNAAILYFAAWFSLNVLLTLYNKAMFHKFKFPYPLLTTSVHMITTSIGVTLARTFCHRDTLVPAPPLKGRALLHLAWFSVIFSLNIWVSNLSLMVVSVSFHQVSRSTVPLFTMALSAVLFNERYSPRLAPAVLIVIAGVVITVTGDVHATRLGTLLTFVGCGLASLKGILTKRSQVGELGLQTLDMLYYVSPMAAAELILLAYYTVVRFCTRCSGRPPLRLSSAADCVRVRVRVRAYARVYV